ncbi:MAG: HAMP domain-containing protein [Spirochaetaceae bacterium]|jgi:nitrogen fixation/metabolism regulation signal transduction histidine kinase|nr:HAMP domain-containing protein [Spirochaetaceae bacterium]
MLIYLLLCILTLLISRNFFIEILQSGSAPGALQLIVFFTIPMVLMLFLALSLVNLIRDYIANRTGSKFQTRLFAYFMVIVVCAAAPVTILTIQSVLELNRFWRSMQVNSILEDAQRFALDAYSLRLEHFETLLENQHFDAFMARYGREEAFFTVSPDPETAGTRDASDDETDAAALRAREEAEQYEAVEFLKALELTGVQDFLLGDDGTWVSRHFAGIPSQRLDSPPFLQRGFVPRELPRDTDVIRFVQIADRNRIRLVSCDLGTGFDRAVDTIEEEKARFEIIGSLGINLRPLLIFYYGVFFFPTLLMTIIISFSFTQRVTQPLVELAEATRRVAEGDFSIRILTRPGDELALLVRSFNSMVRDLEKAQGVLLDAEKTSVWQTMAQQLAHEIKNPLTPIKLSADRVLRRWHNEPERIGEILESCMLAILQEVEGLSTLVTEFKTLSRPIEPSRARVALRELTGEIITPYYSSYPQVQFNITYMDPALMVKMDKRYISQVLTNLIINSIDAMNYAGLIEIRTDLVKKRESRYCRLSIRDTGKGISVEDQPSVFIPYFTTKTSGTGLGLPIVERIVKDHGGMIWFNTAVGVGTTFFVDLPLVESGGEDARQ